MLRWAEDVSEWTKSNVVRFARSGKMEMYIWFGRSGWNEDVVWFGMKMWTKIWLRSGWNEDVVQEEWVG